ncbi:MAG: hypothetical protein OEW46_13275 [Actinomycetota bacterium]|nr:hypothetical protein [Actinomycetota bacterium]
MRRAVTSMVFGAALVSLIVVAPTSAAPRLDPASGSRTTCPPTTRAVSGGACTHGGDDVPSPISRISLRAPTPSGPATQAMCVGNGRNGRRIRVYYGFPNDTASRASTYRSWIRQSIAMADSNLDAQSPGVGGQHLRMYCKNGRKITVSAIALLPIGGDGSYVFGDVLASLLERVTNGLGDADIDTPRYTYVVFVDNITCCYRPAGQGTIYYDDRSAPDVNLNNLAAFGPRFAMVEIGGSPFTGSYVFQHEVGHTIGAVQLSAPHSSGAAHCYTSADIMCYADGGPYFTGGGSMESVCAPMPDGQFPFDCQGGDYYEIAPDTGSYLASFWNTANSGWLTKPG